MRIVHVVLSLEVGGQERLILALSRELLRRGHRVSVVSLTPGGALADELGDVGVACVARRDGVDVGLVPRLCQTLAGLAPDVVHTHNAAPLIYAVPAARVARARRVVHTKHGNNAYGKGALILARAAARGVSRFVAVSRETADAARTWECPRVDDVRVVQNGIAVASFARDLDARRAVRAELGIPEDAVVLGSVGRLVGEKDFSLLVRATHELLGDRVRLIIAGDGPCRDEIVHAIPASVARYVSLVGQRRDVPRILSALDLFCSSSRTEGLPLAIPEALACSLPIVATRVGGVPGIVPPELGVLVPHGDARALRDAIHGLVHDPTRRAAMSEKALSYARARFSVERMTDEYEALYSGAA